MNNFYKNERKRYYNFFGKHIYLFDLEEVSIVFEMCLNMFALNFLFLSDCESNFLHMMNHLKASFMLGKNLQS